MKKIVWLFLLSPVIGHAEVNIAISPQQMRTLGITLAPIAKASPVTSNRLPGEIVVPIGQERIVSAPQSGLIDALYVAAGQTVKRGQKIAHITSADLVALQRDYLRAKSQHQLSRSMLDRDRELYKDGIIAERRLLATESGHQEVAAEVQQRQQALKMAGMADATIGQLEQRGEMSNGITLTAPMDGTVLEQMVAVGQRADTSTPIYRIARLKPLWLEIHAPLDILQFAKVGMAVAIPKYQAFGKITTILRSVNRDDQTIHLRAEISTGSEKLSPGQFVEAELAAEITTGQFSIPQSALVRTGHNSYVFMQSGQGFNASPVTVISEQSSQAIVSGKFSGNEKIAVSGTASLKAAWNGLESQ